MIHVATVHYMGPEWIDVQRRYLARFLTEPYRTYASLEGIDETYHEAFDVVVPSLGSHAGKLNLLSQEMVRAADPDDLLIFIDGDAFPVADPLAVVVPLLETHELVAVRRDENGGDCQPHPCFAAVRAEAWERIRGDWQGGHPFNGSRTDVGANLLYQLEADGLPWAPLLRTNKVDLHPVLFGIYGDVVYHHGAAFRRYLGWLPQMTTLGDPLDGKTKVDVNERDRRNREVSETVLARMSVDPNFYEMFL